jgi:WD40 repeat protein
VNQASFSPDGNLILTASSDGTARIWDAVELTQRFVFSGHQQSVTSATFSTDGHAIITGSADGTFRIWDAITNISPPVETAHDDAVLSGAITADGAHFASAGADGKAIIWEIDEAAHLRERARLSIHRGRVLTSIAFGSDWHQILTATSLGEITALTH